MPVPNLRLRHFQKYKLYPFSANTLFTPRLQFVHIFDDNTFISHSFEDCNTYFVNKICSFFNRFRSFSEEPASFGFYLIS